MGFLDDIYAGAVLGLFVSMRVLVGRLPDNKVSFIVCGLLCYLLLGGFSSAVLKILAGVGVYFLNINLTTVLTWIWTTVYDGMQADMTYYGGGRGYSGHGGGGVAGVADWLTALLANLR